MANQRHPDKVYFSGWIDKDLKKSLKSMAKKRGGVPLATLVAEILQKEMDAEEAAKKSLPSKEPAPNKSPK